MPSLAIRRASSDACGCRKPDGNPRSPSMGWMTADMSRCCHVRPNAIRPRPPAVRRPPTPRVRASDLDPGRQMRQGVDEPFDLLFGPAGVDALHHVVVPVAHGLLDLVGGIGGGTQRVDECHERRFGGFAVAWLEGPRRASLFPLNEFGAHTLHL